MSKSIAINAGSSSLKFQLLEMPEETVVAKGLVERIGMEDAIFTISYGEDQEYKVVEPILNHEVAVEKLLEQLVALEIIASFDEITGVGHRVVAGGELFKDSALVDDEVIKQVEELAEFAPLHNKAEAIGMKAFKKVLPDITSVAVFDTSFHTSMPKKAYLYSVPMEYYTEFKARKYGAHGTSHRFVARRAAEMLGKPLEELKIITCHLGNGASITAVDGGKSVDTSMGFSPLAGLTMGTRCGDIDASLVGFLMNKLNITDINEFVDILNHKSGLLGLSGVSSDMRDVETAAAEGNEDAQVALEIFVDRVQKYIGQYVAVMNGVDAIVFTAGIGENSKETRRDVINGLTWFGCAIDEERNNTRKEAIISPEGAKVAVLNIPTNEEVEIARDIERLRK
ncbi:acetate kinase [Granulicatella balaenopterae]|uniref:Acetate kinase n=1 Tax=Granulicatella balaenopterae TaxID=137733 RepID=A0A1H9PUN1_9LACT|nr:acetate kinase [Granulicatella balaenopterae]SER51818.1 acetate kinase [Granulicatella balaenopterae]